MLDRTRVRIIDTSAGDGSMVAGREIELRGHVFSPKNINLHNGVLRVASGYRYDAGYIESFDVRGKANIKAINRVNFGYGEAFSFRLFQANRAFFKSADTTLPLFAFDITDEGEITEMTGTAAIGDDRVHSVFDAERLIGLAASGAFTPNAALTVRSLRHKWSGLA